MFGKESGVKNSSFFFFFFFKDKSYCTMFYVDRNDSVNRDNSKERGDVYSEQESP